MLSEIKVNEPKIFFYELGGLHDVRITGLSWFGHEKYLRMSVDDLNGAFLGLPEYLGVCPAEIIFTNVQCLDCDIQIIGIDAGIYDFVVEGDGDFFEVKIRCTPGGYFRCKFEHVLVVKK